jgi:hypothetical protein
MGEKRGPISKRFSLSWPHQPSKRGSAVPWCGQIVGLPDQRERDLAAALFQRAQRIVALHHRIGGEAVKPRLRCDRISIRRKRSRLDQDAELPRPRAVERHHQQMEVHRQRVHHHHFNRQSANQPRSAGGQ